MTDQEISATEQANFSAGLDAQLDAAAALDSAVPATLESTSESAAKQDPAAETAKQETSTAAQPITPDDEDPYAGLTSEQKEIRILEEKACEMALAYKMAMDAANARKAEIAKQEKLLADYYALIKLVTVGDDTLAELLAANKQAIIECLKDQRIKVGTPQPVPQNGSIGIHHSNNGSKVINGALLPEKKERKITPEIAAQCRYEYSNGLASITELASRYDVKPGYMGNVVRGVRGDGRKA